MWVCAVVLAITACLCLYMSFCFVLTHRVGLLSAGFRWTPDRFMVPVLSPVIGILLEVLVALGVMTFMVAVIRCVHVCAICRKPCCHTAASGLCATLRVLLEQVLLSCVFGQGLYAC